MPRVNSVLTKVKADSSRVISKHQGSEERYKTPTKATLIVDSQFKSNIA